MLGGRGFAVKLARWVVPGLGAVIVAGAAAYLLTMPRAGPAHPTQPARAAGQPARATRVVAWADPPGPQSTGWQRERWIMSSQSAFLRQEWRGANCPPIRLGSTYYFFVGPPYGNLSLSGPVASYPSPTSPWPSWWLTPIPPTGFPKPGQFGC
jgi:hypothetical protein